MITASQIRAARALLNWSATDLAEKSGLTRETVSRAETDAVQVREDSLEKIINALEESGIEFLPSEGIRKRNRIVEVFDDKEANRRLLDDVYKTMRDIGGEVLIAGLDEDMFMKDLDEEFVAHHLGRLAECKVTERLLIEQGDMNFVAPKSTYRWTPEKYFSPYPLYIYGPKIALVSWAPSSRCIIVNDQAFAESARRLFNFVWDHCKVPDNT